MDNFSKKYYKINELEEKYTDLLWEIFTSDEFETDLHKIENYLIENKDKLKDLWKTNNIAKVSIERLIRFYVYRKLNIEDIYPSPLSSDLAVVLDDIVLTVDAKTINMAPKTNPGDDKAIHFGKDQITFENSNGFGKEKVIHNGREYLINIPFIPTLEPYYDEKPVLTYFFTLNYFDDWRTMQDPDYKFVHKSLTCVPHKVVVDNKFDNNIISNYKVYSKVKNKTDIQPAGNLSKQFKSIKSDRNLIKHGNLYIDPSLKHPFLENISVCRTKDKSGNYQVILEGGSARILKTTLQERKDNNNETWKGVRTIRYYKINEDGVYTRVTNE